MRMTTEQVALRLGRHPGTVHAWRRRSQGPPYHKMVGEVFYESEEVDAWIQSCRVVPGIVESATDGTNAAAGVG